MSAEVVWQKRVVVEIEGSAGRPVPYSRTPSTYRPRRAVITYIKHDDAAWALSGGVELHGPRIKKDGTDSTVWTSERLYSDLPAWVRTLVDGHWPTDGVA